MKNQLTKILSLIILTTILSCSNGIDGKIIDQNVVTTDFGKNDKWEFVGGGMDRDELRKKYSRDIIRQFDLNMGSGCEPYFKFKDLKQLILKNTSTDKELRFTILKTIKAYDLKMDEDSCMEPIFDNPTITTDTDFETLEPGDREVLGAEKFYSDGKFIEIKYELTGAKAEK